MPDADTVGQDDDLIRAQLARILQSADFSASARMRRLLEYVVAETLAGRADRIKAYTLATMVLERGSDFDPQLDPIVRLEASRLRRALDLYYLTAGKNDPVRISVPKGSYAAKFEMTTPAPAADPPPPPQVDKPTVQEPTQEPAFREPTPAAPPAPPRRRWLVAVVASVAALAVLAGLVLLLQPDLIHGGGRTLGGVPVILVIPFESDGDAQAASLAYGLTDGVISDLTRFSDLFVFGLETTFARRGYRSPINLAAMRRVDYIVHGRVTVDEQHFRTTISLIEAKSGQNLWSVQSEGVLSPSYLFEQEAEIAGQVARAIAQPYGVLFNNRIKEIASKPPDRMTSYECVLAFQLHHRADAIEKFALLRACLTRAIRDDPFYADAYASLALLDLAEYRIAFGMPKTGEDRRLAALDLAQQAVKFEPDSGSGFYALHVAFWYLNEVDQSFEAAEHALALNPNNTQVLASFGARLCLRGDWNKGLPLLKQAFVRNPALSDTYHYIFFLDYYRRGEAQKAFVEASQVHLPDEIVSYVVLALAHAALGHTAQAQDAVQHILRLSPTFGDHAAADFAANNFDPALITQIVDGLAAAGLPINKASQ